MYNPQSGSRGGLYCGQHRDLGMLDSAEEEGWVGIGCNLGLPLASSWWVWPISPVWLHWAAPDWDHNTDSRHDPCRTTMHWLMNIKEPYGALKLKSVPSRRIDGFVKTQNLYR